MKKLQTNLSSKKTALQDHTKEFLDIWLPYRDKLLQSGINPLAVFMGNPNEDVTAHMAIERAEALLRGKGKEFKALKDLKK